MRRAAPFLVIAGAVAVFAAAVLMLVKTLPGPHTRTDYLVIGSLATLATLGVLFAGWIARRAGGCELFGRKRRR